MPGRAVNRVYAHAPLAGHGSDIIQTLNLFTLRTAQSAKGAMDDQQVPEFLQPFQIEFSVATLFDKHVETLKESKRQRREALQIKSVAASSSLAASGVAAAGDMGEVRPTDKFAGDAALRTLYRLLALIDDRGFARSSQQLTFHNSFTRATARVIFRDDWSRAQPQIQEMNNWESCPSEVLVSTPRRFGLVASPPLASQVATPPHLPVQQDSHTRTLVHVRWQEDVLHCKLVLQGLQLVATRPLTHPRSRRTFVSPQSSPPLWPSRAAQK
jgi:hypothetical protein